MPYNDIPWVSYDGLKDRTRMRPYANAANTFPLGDRKYSHRHFRVRDDGVFELYLGNRAVVDAGLSSQPAKRSPDPNVTTHYANLALIARVYADNSFEFLSTRGGLADLIIYDSMIRNSHISCNSRYGGGVMSFDPGKMHPLFHGLRINLSDLSAHSSSDYVTYLPTLNRKEGKEFSTIFDEFHRAWRVLFEPMQRNAYAEIVKDLAEEYPAAFAELIASKKDPRYYHQSLHLDEKELTDMILDLISKRRYADVAIASLGYKHCWVLYRLYRSEAHDKNYFHNFDEMLSKAIGKLVENCMKHTPRLFSHRAIESGSPLVATKWGLITMLKSTGETVIRL
jgi:hypothetical protein